MSLLSLYDLTGIQSYIFGSNVLKENLGGSYLAGLALNDWLREAAQAVNATPHWSGGGNAMVESADLDRARQLATLLSARLQHEAPGLQVVCAHADWDGSDAGFRDAREALQARVQTAKDGRWPAASFDGAGLTEHCAQTMEPAMQQDADGRWLGATAGARVDRAREAQQRLNGFYRLEAPRTWTAELNKLGRSPGSQSQLGVIHIDGNGMGRRFQHAQTLRQQIALSEAVMRAGQETLKAGLNWVHQRLEGITDEKLGGFRLAPDGDSECFPVRPIVYGGDDITLVCDARIALDLAAELLRAWHRETERLPGGAAHACAGVALVRVNYPFYRAYRLAEDLCRGAKHALGDAKERVSVLDWELIAGAGLTRLEQRRDSELYRVGRAQLHARPYYVVGDPPATQPYRCWQWFRETLLNAIQAQADSHTRFKDLAQVLQRGPDATEIYLARLRDRFGLSRAVEWTNDGPLCLPEPAGSPMQSGFLAGATPYLDAIELMDRILPLACYKLPEPPSSPAGGAQ